MDKLAGDHQIGCSGNGDRILRHNAIHNVIFTAAQTAGLTPARETPGLISNSSSKPADNLPAWHNGRPAALDIHVISPLQSNTLSEASVSPGHALRVGVQCKLTSSLSACCSLNFDFAPLIAESLGGLAEDTISTIPNLGRAISNRVGTHCSISTRRVTVALWRGNARRAWLHRQPVVHPCLDGVLYSSYLEPV